MLVILSWFSFWLTADAVPPRTLLGRHIFKYQLFISAVSAHTQVNIFQGRQQCLHLSCLVGRIRPHPRIQCLKLMIFGPSAAQLLFSCLLLSLHLSTLLIEESKYLIF